MFILQATNEYFTGDGNLAKIIIDIYKKNLVANYILLIQKFEVYDENLNRLLKQEYRNGVRNLEEYWDAVCHWVVSY
jgi:hypothetical protein